MKIDALVHSLYLTFKIISFIGFIVAGVMTIALSYTNVYKKYLKNDRTKIDKYKPYFIIVAILIEAVYLFIYKVLFQ
jgi:hypothetical protein